MKYIVVGNGNIGKKRRQALKDKCAAVVDPFEKDADYKSCKDVPPDTFDAAVLAVPNAVKMEILEYLLGKKKHVLLEKPLLFKNESMAKKLHAQAIANNVVWYTSYNHRFEPSVMKLKQLLEEKTLGEFYFARFVYGNGTVQNIANTWRDVDCGVLEDLGCHLLDFAAFFFAGNPLQYRITSGIHCEAKTWDSCSFVSRDGRLHFLCSTLMWKNTFEIDIFGSKGSLHVAGLNKWGGSRVIRRERIFPSGVPREETFSFSGPDETWKRDIEFFEEMTALGRSSYHNDLYISESIRSLASNP
ncbi:MAG: Gfo/Idh/MocA family oxidoreductase [Deltaproteobacteria bacterium]|nr:Gfo/Idh/MocA family oxidoreductase [Deltaproteobacteria bacterium]